MLYFDSKKRHVKEEKDIASIENNKRYWNERFCYISESIWDVQYRNKCGSYCLALQSYKRFVHTSLNKSVHFPRLLASQELQ